MATETTVVEQVDRFVYAVGAAISLFTTLWIYYQKAKAAADAANKGSALDSVMTGAEVFMRNLPGLLREVAPNLTPDQAQRIGRVLAEKAKGTLQAQAVADHAQVAIHAELKKLGFTTKQIVAFKGEGGDGAGTATSGPSALVAALSLLPLIGLACKVTVYHRDPYTIASIQTEIEAEDADYARWRREMLNPTPTARDLRGIELLHVGTLDRLKALKLREEQKFEEGE